MALTAIMAVGTAASAVAQNKAAKAQKRAANDARIAAQAQSEANRQAAENASARDAAARQAEANQAEAAAQLDDTADVSIVDTATQSARRRQVRAQFNVGDSGATTSGSIRL